MTTTSRAGSTGYGICCLLPPVSHVVVDATGCSQRDWKWEKHRDDGPLTYAEFRALAAYNGCYVTRPYDPEYPHDSMPELQRRWNAHGDPIFRPTDDARNHD